MRKKEIIKRLQELNVSKDTSGIAWVAVANILAQEKADTAMKSFGYQMRTISWVRIAKFFFWLFTFPAVMIGYTIIGIGFAYVVRILWAYYFSP